jgi:hypothetical protein
MHLRALIQGRQAPAKLDDRIQSSSLRTPAIVAIPATVHPASPPTIATIATFAAPADPETWLAMLRRDGLPLLPAPRWAVAVDALESLMRSGAVAKALELGWDARELIGVQRRQPHDAPHCAGLIFSMRAGDTVTDVRRSGCLISYSNVRHIWKRVPLPADGSICLPWELAK